MINHTQEILNTIKKLGMKVEYELNDSIQEALNQPDILKETNARSQLVAASIQKLQQTVEHLSIPFNFPTKSDVANTTKLFIQAEEKLDLLEEQVIHLNHSIEDLKNMITNNHSYSKRVVE